MTLDTCSIDADGLRGRTTAVAEAEPKEELGQRTQVEEIAFMVVAVTERCEVQSLGHDRRHGISTDISGEGLRIPLHLWICRAEIGQGAVTEGIAWCSFRMQVGQPCVVQVH